MGRKPRTGVRTVSASSIELSFTYQGKRCREKVKLKPTPANLKRAERHLAAILDAIEKGTFDYATTFPKSKNAPLFSDQPGITERPDFLSVGRITIVAVFTQAHPGVLVVVLPVKLCRYRLWITNRRAADNLVGGQQRTREGRQHL